MCLLLLSLGPGLDGGADDGGGPLVWTLDVGGTGLAVALLGDLEAGKRKVPLLVFWLRLVSVLWGSGLL